LKEEYEDEQGARGVGGGKKKFRILGNPERTRAEDKKIRAPTPTEAHREKYSLCAIKSALLLTFTCTARKRAMDMNPGGELSPREVRTEPRGNEKENDRGRRLNNLTPTSLTAL